jgi:hypothetical protein
MTPFVLAPVPVPAAGPHHRSSASSPSPWVPRPEPGGPHLLRREDLLAQGFTDNHIRRARREGALTALARGVYLSAVEWQQLDDAGRYRVMLSAVIAGLPGDPVVSHRSAGIVHGFVDAVAEPSAVDVIRSGPAKSRYGPGLRVHRGSLAADEVMRVHRLAVTSATRTVLDCLLSLPAGPAAEVVRRALAGGCVTPSDLQGQLIRHQRTPGVRTAGAVVHAVITERSSLRPPPSVRPPLPRPPQPHAAANGASGRSRGAHPATVISTWAGSAAGASDPHS